MFPYKACTFSNTSTYVTCFKRHGDWGWWVEAVSPHPSVLHTTLGQAVPGQTGPGPDALWFRRPFAPISSTQREAPLGLQPRRLSASIVPNWRLTNRAGQGCPRPVRRPGVTPTVPPSQSQPAPPAHSASAPIGRLTAARVHTL